MKKNYKNPYLLIDGNYCLYQSHYTFTNLKNKNLFPTSILYGFIKTINRLIQKIQPKKIIVIFDAPTKNFRHKIYKNYKKNRKMMPKEIQIQIEPLKKIIFSMGIPILKIKNFEADDIIGTLSVQLKKKNNCIFIYSADKDMIQLIKKDIFIIPGNFKKKILNHQEILKKYGFLPNVLTNFLSLVGDISDNIPGIKGIGKKTALILLKEFNCIKKIYKNLNKIHDLPIRGKKRIINILEKNKKNAFISLKLATINTKINIPINKKYYLKKPNYISLSYYFKYYGLIEYLKELKKKFFPILNLYKKNKKIS